MRTLRIRVPEQLYIASAPRRTPEPKRAVQRPKPAAPAPAAAKPQAPAPAETHRAAAPRRRFDLPPAQHRTQSSQSLIQPLQPPDLLPQPGLRLPEVFFWAPPVSRMPPKPFVQPGHAVPPARPRVLDAPPRLDLPTLTPTAPLQVAQLMTRSPLEARPDSQPIRTNYPDQPSPRSGP
ncbi:MAG TPA: hypothetical protein PLK67_12950, partial [Bryobacteraceae bacterium]|nr:hypothetical protein [Bryobacteraceae bacterium]